MRPPSLQDLSLARDIADAPPVHSRCQVTVREDSYQVANSRAGTESGAPRLAR